MRARVMCRPFAAVGSPAEPAVVARHHPWADSGAAEQRPDGGSIPR